MVLSQRYIGLMSGTSCDGVDAVGADFNGDRVATLGHVHVPFHSAQREQLQSLMQSGENEIERLGDASVALARIYVAATEQLLGTAGLVAKDIAGIGAHGQTVRHRPERGFTLQINQPALIAELTGIAVVADFRARDVAAGGQGAPLVPAFHAAVFSSDKPRAVVNIGGIANVSLLPARGDVIVGHRHLTPSLDDGGAATVRGFDTGPGNALLDGWCARHTGKPFDENGAWGATGRVNGRLLALLLDEPYFNAVPPKSTGRELFNMVWLDAQLAAFGEHISSQDVQATLVTLTAQSISREVQGYEVFVCGGGVLNRELMRQIPGAKSTLELGVDPMQVEALAFAWLARECLAARPGNLPAVTGARGSRVLGAIYPA